jgi:phosphatidylglycerophosphate synthase
MIPYPELFPWWAIVISSGIAFTTLVSIYLYVSQRKLREENHKKTGISRVGRDFIFVWVLLALLILYIVSIGNSTDTLFAAGNIVVELVLFIYLLKNGTKF